MIRMKKISGIIKKRKRMEKQVFKKLKKKKNKPRIFVTRNARNEFKP